MRPEGKNFLSTLAGARAEILERCPTERLKFQSLGLAILITSGMATVSMWFALFSAMGVNPLVALVAALMWGLIIMGIDRWLVSSMPTVGARRWTIALPRLLLALLLGSLISTPLVLRIFESEINAQIVLIKQQRASAFLAVQQSSHVGQQVAFWTKDVDNLQKVIDSGGDVPLNPSTDPLVISLTKQRSAELTLEHQYYKQWQCQLYGGPGCTVKGNGPLAKASQRSYERSAAQVANLTNQIQQRDKRLTATDAASKRTRYQQATSALPEARRQLATAVAREDALQQKFDAQNLATNGLLIRLEALSQLSGKSFTINTARLLLFLLFLMIECLPVTVKLMQQPGNYEKILQTAQEEELKDARRAYRGRPRTASVPDPNGVASLSTVPDLRDIWQQPSKAVPSWERTATAVRPPEEPTEAEEHTQLDDEALRQMQDVTATADADWRTGGIELRYGDDDL